MDDAESLIKKGVKEGTIIVADYQEAGIGRFSERIWQSKPGKNLLFTLILNKKNLPFKWLRMPVLSGLSVSLAIEKLFAIKTDIKWPNDVLFEGKKLAGVLCKTSDSYLLIGIGINCNQKEFLKPIKQSACSIIQILNKEIDKSILLLEILTTLKDMIQDKEWRIKFESRLYLKEKKCIVFCGYYPFKTQIEGFIKGVDSEGALILKAVDSGELIKVVSGSIFTE